MTTLECPKKAHHSSSSSINRQKSRKKEIKEQQKLNKINLPKANTTPEQMKFIKSSHKFDIYFPAK